MTGRKPETDRCGAFALPHEVTRCIVDGCNMVCIEGMPNPEHVGRDADAYAENPGARTEVLRRHDSEQGDPAGEVEKPDTRRHAGQSWPYPNRLDQAKSHRSG